RLGLSGTHGRRAHAGARRRRQGRAFAQRLDVLRTLRGSLPGAHPAAALDALLARTRVRAASLARNRTRRAQALGILRQTPGVIRARDGARIARAVAVGPLGRPFPPASLRHRLDAPPRFPGAARDDVPGAVAAKAIRLEGV